MNIEQLTLHVKENIDIIEYITQFLGYEKTANKTYSCPMCGSNDNVKHKTSENFIKCFGCETSGNIIDLTMKIKKLDFVGALKDISLNMDINHNLDNDKTTAETQEEIEARQKKFLEDKAKREKKEQQKQHLEIEAQNKAKIYMSKTAPTMTNELIQFPFEYMNRLNALFPNISNTFQDWQSIYLGFDKKHDTIAIINQNSSGEVFNIKHRQKYKWDDENKKHLKERTAGKWISQYASTVQPFPMDYFNHKSKTDDTVFITEGEKDALNLLSYDINVLTLGGVATSWEDHKYLLKDKTVYIWFDNDQAGYKNAILRYNEISQVVKDVYIVLFYQINSTLGNKYDISDYLKDKKFKNKNEILHSIAFSSFKLTTDIIKGIEDFTALDLKEFYFNQQTTSFPDILKSYKDEFDKNNSAKLTARGEKDIANLDDFMDNFKTVKNTKDFKGNTQKALIDIFLDQDVHQNLSEDKRNEKALDLTTALATMVSNYETIYKDYRQTHIVDMYEAFEALSRKTGFTLAKYDDMLAVWTGTHYHIVEDRVEDFTGFLLKDWMRLAQIDKKKRTARNTNDIIENLHMKADSLNRIHHYQKDKRVVNFTNGTLFITNKGKKTFIPHHDKKHGVMNMLEFEYNPDALCPKWNKFINKVLPDEKDRETLMQFIGYCFFPGHDYEAYLFLYGKSGANGKSVILDVLRKFFGDDNISNLNIQQFVGHELHGLANKLINIGSELDAKGLNDGQMGVLKALTSTNDAVQINPKFTKGYPLASRHQPKLINSGNAKPNPKVMDDGVYRRTLLLEFDYEIKDDEKIRDLSTRFNDELSGIMAYALRSLDTLILNGKFTKSDRLLGSIEEYKDQTNPIRAFIKDNIIEDETIIVPKKLLYAFYKSWCEEKGLYTTSEPKFFTQIFENIKSAEDKKQLRVPVQNPLVEILGTERPNWIGGIYVKSQDLISFMYKNKETTTESLNRNIDTKQVIIKEKDD